MNIRKGLAARKIDGIYFIVDAAGEKLHELNSTGGVIWEGLRSGLSGDAIVVDLCREFDVDSATAKRDMADFFKVLSAENILERGEP